VSEHDALRREQAYLDDALDGWPDRFPTVPVRRVVEHDRPAAALIAAALTAELLVVGHRQRGLLDRLGSVAHAVVHRSVCPVLVVPLRRPAPSVSRV
jgi:nucleotide-binding universal stress UspA family protein